MFDPNSSFAQAISRLFTWTLVVSGLIFALVVGLLVVIIVRFRARPGQGLPRQVAGHTRLEIAWTIAPALLLAVMFSFTVATMRASDPPADRAPDLVVTGYQWWWKIEYPQTGIVTANEVHIPVGKPILVRLETGDVIHDFWVPKLGPKRDMIPNRPNFIWLAANQPGLYPGACSEFCGLQHAGMRILVVAQTQADFDAWQRQQQRLPVAAAGDTARGAQLYQNLTCVNCHTLGPTVGSPSTGPNLTHVGDRRTLGAGVIDNTPQNLLRWIGHPDTIKPGVSMPGYAQALSEQDLRTLVTYLESLK